MLAQQLRALLTKQPLLQPLPPCCVLQDGVEITLEERREAMSQHARLKEELPSIVAAGSFHQDAKVHCPIQQAAGHEAIEHSKSEAVRRSWCPETRVLEHR
jgi:hypothetical protein